MTTSSSISTPPAPGAPMGTTTTLRPTLPICPPWCVGHLGAYQDWEARCDGTERIRDHAEESVVIGNVSVMLCQTESDVHGLAPAIVEVYVDDRGADLTSWEAHKLAEVLTEKAATCFRARHAATASPRHDRLGQA